MLQRALVRLDTLEKDVNFIYLFIDRGIRGHNLRFINIPEESHENCLIKIAKVIKNNATAENKRLSDLLPRALVRLDTLEKDVNFIYLFIDRGIRGITYAL